MCRCEEEAGSLFPLSTYERKEVYERDTSFFSKIWAARTTSDFWTRDSRR